MRLVVAVRTKLREKTPAALVTNRFLLNHDNQHYFSPLKYQQCVSSSLPPAEFDDLEMCTSLSHHQDYEGVGSSWYAGSNSSSNRGVYEMGDESASLQHLVQDLRSQLTRCHKVIRGLQLRVRSLSATSDYASSLERTPRKVPQH